MESFVSRCVIEKPTVKDTYWNTMFVLLDSILNNFDQIEHLLKVHNEDYR